MDFLEAQRPQQIQMLQANITDEQPRTVGSLPYRVGNDTHSQILLRPFPQSTSRSNSKESASQPHPPFLKHTAPTHTSHAESQTTTSIEELWMSGKHRIASLRNLVLTARMDVKREKTRCRQQEELFHGIMDEFIAVLDTNSYFQHKADLNRLSRKLKTTRDELKALREGTSTLEDALSSHEYRLTELEDEVYSQLDQEYRQNILPLSSNTLNTPPNRSGQPEDASSDTIETLREKLYSRMSDVRIFLDRLTNFEYDLGQELDERDLLRAAGQIDISSDEQFFEEAKAERSRIQHDLEQAQTEVIQLNEQCTRLGLEFKDIQIHNPCIDEECIYNKPFSAMPNQAETRHNQRGGSSSILDSFFSARERVRDWLASPSHQNFQFHGNVMGTQEWALSVSESNFGCSLVPMPESSQNRRPSSPLSLEAFDRCHNYPQWTAGPPPGSELLEALSLEPVSHHPPRTMRRNISCMTL